MVLWSPLRPGKISEVVAKIYLGAPPGADIDDGALSAEGGTESLIQYDLEDS